MNRAAAVAKSATHAAAASGSQNLARDEAAISRFHCRASRSSASWSASLRDARRSNSSKRSSSPPRYGDCDFVSLTMCVIQVGGQKLFESLSCGEQRCVDVGFVCIEDASDFD